MKKRKSNNMVVMVIAICIILLGGVGVYFFKDNELNIKNEDKKNNTTTSFDEITEKENLNTNIKEIETTLGFMTVLTGIDKYNAGGDYITKKNENLLKDTEDKQLFIMEQIASNKDNYNNFIVLNTSGEIDNEGATPVMDATTSYYPYNLFEEEYQKYFKENFDVEKRKTSNMNSTYDKDKNYIYYENRRAGMNGLSSTGITIEKISETKNGEYKADITLNYNERLSGLLGVDSEQAELIYQRNGETIQINSYMLK